nr:site-specific integrase [Halorhodospira halophila]
MCVVVRPPTKNRRSQELGGEEVLYRRVPPPLDGDRQSAAHGSVVRGHRLRHTCASEIAAQPQPDLRGLQQLLGHSSLMTTMQYLEPDLGQLHRLVDSLPDPRSPHRGPGRDRSQDVDT